MPASESSRPVLLTIDGGGYLFVGVDSTQLDEMQEMISRAFLWGLLATILLSLVGGTIMSLGLLRHVEAVSQTSRDIIAGDLIPDVGANTSVRKA